MVTAVDDKVLLEQASAGITAYLQSQRDAGLITGTYYEEAERRTMPALTKWLSAEELDRISPGLRDGLRAAIQREEWVQLANAFSREVAFGTGGIREKMGPTRDVVLQLKEKGVHAPIVKGPNTINDVVYLMTSAGVARFGKERTPNLQKIVIGYDSRVRGRDFAKLIAELFLAYDYTVYLFDEACLYPSVTYAVPRLRADVGVFISASHNDFRYNGYKLSCANGSQFDPSERATLYEKYIKTTKFADIRRTPLAEAPKEKLWILGGQKPKTPRALSGSHEGLPQADPAPGLEDLYAGREDQIIDMHTLHTDHVKQFLHDPTVITAAKDPLHIAYSAFNGSGRKAVPRLLSEIGFKNVTRIMALDPLDGMFPAFCSDPGKEQQPDPGDWRAADIAVDAFKKENPGKWEDVDLIIGTDPDADRCGVIVKIPQEQRKAYLHVGTGEERDYSLLSADEVWSLILWYRLSREIEETGCVKDADKKFITLSHTTTDLLTRIARKFGLGVCKTWVGFAQLAAAARAAWDLSAGKDTPGLTEGGKFPEYDEGRTSPDQAKVNRSIHSVENMDGRNFNIAALEQSNGFSLLGGPPKDERSLGEDGHVRDKDGTFAAVLVTELCQWAKDQGRSIIDLLDEKLYLDPAIGLYVTHYEPDPIDGEYEGLAGYTKKRGILDKCEALFRDYVASPFELGGLPVLSATSYRTGKYDAVNWEGFPDEGYRFYFDDTRESHLTIRPSGTSNALRFHVQLCGGTPAKDVLIEKKAVLRKQTVRIVDDIRKLIGAER